MTGLRGKAVPAKMYRPPKQKQPKPKSGGKNAY